MPSLRVITILMAVLCCAAFVGCAPAETDDPTSETETGPDMQPNETGGALSAESLVGTTWSLADYTIAFEDDEVVTFNGTSKGTWSVDDSTITLEVAGETTTIEIDGDGDGLTQDGMALARQ